MSLEDILGLDSAGVTAFFEDEARCQETLAGAVYTIRVGSRILQSTDTYELKQQLVRYLAGVKRVRTMARKRAMA